jgi:hypothetical protein
MKKAPVCFVSFSHGFRDGIERRVDQVGPCYNHGKEALL